MVLTETVTTHTCRQGSGSPQHLSVEHLTHPLLVDNKHRQAQPNQHAQSNEACRGLHERHAKHERRGAQQRNRGAVARPNCVCHCPHGHARKDGSADGRDTSIADVSPCEIKGIL